MFPCANPSFQYCDKQLSLHYIMFCHKLYLFVIVLFIRYKLGKFEHSTLIDNSFCKLTEETLDTTSGVLIKKFSDHQPYFTILKNINHKDHQPKYIKIVKQDTEKYIKIVKQDTEQCKCLDKIYKMLLNM